MEIHQQPGQSIEVETDIHNDNIPFECMLPEKLFQNEDSNDSCEKKPINTSDSIQLIDRLPTINEQEDQPLPDQMDIEDHKVS